MENKVDIYFLGIDAGINLVMYYITCDDISFKKDYKFYPKTSKRGLLLKEIFKIRKQRLSK